MNIPTDRAHCVDEKKKKKKKKKKNAVICPVIAFISRVMLVKMSKMVHFFYYNFLLMTAKNQFQVG